MRINFLLHTPNEGPGYILDWAHYHNHEVYTYHPYQYGYLPDFNSTDMLVILGGPMSPNDDIPWIKKERQLIRQLLDRNIPIFGVCYGAQQIVKTLGYKVDKAPAKEVGWGPVYRQNTIITDIPEKVTVLHWHEEMFEVPLKAKLLFSSKALKNQGFLLSHRVVGLQFHLEPNLDSVHEIIVNDFPYIEGSILQQTAKDILCGSVPRENKRVLFKLLDYICEPLVS